jgi:HSP20 family protein
MNYALNRLNDWKENGNHLNDFRREFDFLFDELLHPSRELESTADSRFVPVCEVEEQEDHYLLTVETAGVKKDDLKMELVDNQIVIRGVRRSESRGKRVTADGLVHSERRYGRFQRSFALPPGVDSAQIEANYQDGMLRVVIPKAESAKARSIKITQGAVGSKFFGKLLGKGESAQEPHQDEGRVAS